MSECEHFTADGRSKMTAKDGTVWVAPEIDRANGEKDVKFIARFEDSMREAFATTFKNEWPSTRNCRNDPEHFPECR